MLNLKHFCLSGLLLFAVTLASCMPINFVIKFEPGIGYEIRGDQVYYSPDEGGHYRSAPRELITEAEAGTFQIIEQFGYARDAHHVFFPGQGDGECRGGYI
jgi:hypothetical protein